MSGILPDTGKDNFNSSNKELMESSWKVKKKSPSQKRREKKGKWNIPKRKLLKKWLKVTWLKAIKRFAKKSMKKKLKTFLCAEKASDVKAAKEVDTSNKSHTEEVEAEKTVTEKQHSI